MTKSVVTVVAHLFGGWVNLDQVLEIARDNNLLVVEVCTEFLSSGRFCRPENDVCQCSASGRSRQASALGRRGCVRVKSSDLRANAELLKKDPIQTRSSFLLRLGDSPRLSCCRKSHRCADTNCVERWGGDFDSLAKSVVRGFRSSELLAQLRRQPCTPLLELLRRRWRTYNFARISQRIKSGRYLDNRSAKLTQRRIRSGCTLFLLSIPLLCVIVFVRRGLMQHAKQG